MLQWWESLQTIQQVFYILAIPATVILVIQTVLLFFGLGHDSETDIDHDVDGDTGDIDGDTDGAEHLVGLRLLSVRSIVAFFSICGWTGVAMLDMGVSPLITTLVAIIAGFAAMVLVAFLLKASLKLQQSGNLDMQNAVGLTGEVYVPIAENGKGKVTLVVQERFMEMDAICPTQALKTGTRVKIIGVTESNTLIVAPL